MTIDLSIITVTFNDPQSLALTLKSLESLPPSFPFSWELIVVDSSPTVNETLLSSFEFRDNLVRLVLPPKGIYPAMNSGILKSRGKVLWFLNAGDRLQSPNSLESSLSSLLASREALSLLAGASLSRGGKHLYNQRTKFGEAALWGINRICHQAVLFRRDFFDRVGPFPEDLRLASDYELHLRAIAAHLPSLSSCEIIVDYDMSGASSRLEEVLMEFRLVHERLHREGKLSRPLLHKLFWWWERARIHAFKLLGASIFGTPLRALWGYYKKS
jgi:glycosyltransferase involved in cell wall biosynthesis